MGNGAGFVELRHVQQRPAHRQFWRRHHQRLRSCYGTFLGQLEDQTGAVISNGSLWALVFGAGGTGDPNSLYFTAGLANEGHGLFGALVASTGGTADYSLAASPQSGTVTAGGSMNFTLTVTPANGFSNMVSLSCAASTGITCSFNPTAVTPAGGAATSTLTLTASSGIQHYGALKVMGMAFTGLGVFGCFSWGSGRDSTALVLAAARWIRQPAGGGNAARFDGMRQLGQQQPDESRNCVHRGHGTSGRSNTHDHD